MNATSGPWSCDPEEEGPIDFSTKTTVSQSSASPNNHEHNRQSPVTESDASTDDSHRITAAPKSNGYKWKKVKTSSSSSVTMSSAATSASAAAAAALAAYNLTTPSPSPPDATSTSTMSSLLSSSLQHGGTTTTDMLSHLLMQGSMMYGKVGGGQQVGNGSPTAVSAATAAKLTSLSALQHNVMDTSSTSENDDAMSPNNMDVSGSNGKSSSRKKGRPLPEELKDDAYWERRRKNNEAAKRSRDARRAKEYEVAIRATILEQENLKLRVEIASLKTELAKLRCLMYPAMQQQQQQQSSQSNGNRKGRDSCCRHDHD